MECSRPDFYNKVNLQVVFSVVASQPDFLDSHQHNRALPAFSKQVLVKQIRPSQVFLVSHNNLSNLVAKAAFKVLIKMQLVLSGNKVLDKGCKTRRKTFLRKVCTVKMVPTLSQWTLSVIILGLLNKLLKAKVLLLILLSLLIRGLERFLLRCFESVTTANNVVSLNQITSF